MVPGAKLPASPRHEEEPPVPVLDAWVVHGYVNKPSFRTRVKVPKSIALGSKSVEPEKLSGSQIREIMIPLIKKHWP
jgi:hypothetical protein